MSKLEHLIKLRTFSKEPIKMINPNYLQGLIAFDNRDYKKAKELFLQAIESSSETPEIHFYLGKSYFLCGEKQEAIAPLKTFVQLRQQDEAYVENVSYAFDLLGQCYEAEQNSKAALTCFETATKLNPSCASGWHNMALLYIKSAQENLEENLEISFKLFNGAQIFLKNALILCSEHPAFLHTVASWYETYIEALKKLTTEDKEAVEKNISNNYRLSIEYYRKALAACKVDDIGLQNLIKENFTECLAQYGHHLYQEAKYTEAQVYYQEAVQFDENHLTALSQIGMSQFKQNNFAEARKYFSTILSKTDDHQELADAWLNIACTHRSEKSWQEAEDALKRAKAFTPEDPAIAEEEAKLVEVKLQATYVSSPHILLNRLNTVAQSEIPQEINDISYEFK